MHNIERYHAIPDTTRCSLRREWMTETAQMIRAKALATVSLYEEEQMSDEKRTLCGMHPDATILCFDLRRPAANGSMQRLSLEEARRVHNLMARDLSFGCGSSPVAGRPHIGNLVETLIPGEV